MGKKIKIKKREELEDSAGSVVEGDSSTERASSERADPHQSRDADLAALDTTAEQLHAVPPSTDPLPEDFYSNGNEPPAGGMASAGESKLVEELRAEVEQYRDKYLRSLAEIDNIRKRATKERADLLKYQGESIFVDMVGVLDSFEFALASPGEDLEQFKKGVTLIQKQFVDALAKWNVVGRATVGDKFDPTIQNALSEVPLEGGVPGTVANELKRPYFYKDRLIRHGEVVVVSAGSRTEAGSDQESTDESGEEKSSDSEG